DISVFFLFSPPRRTPSSTVFPYTTLFRSLLAGSMVADFGEDALNDGAEVFQFSTDQQNPNSGGRGHDRDEVRASNDWADHLRKLLGDVRMIGDRPVAALVNRQHGDGILQTRSLARLELGDPTKGFLVDDGAVRPEVPAGHSVSEPETSHHRRQAGELPPRARGYSQATGAP